MNLFSLAQNLLPQQKLSELAGNLARSQNPYIKKSLISAFAKVYDISLYRLHHMIRLTIYTISIEQHLLSRGHTSIDTPGPTACKSGKSSWRIAS